VASDAVILQRLRALWGGADLKLVAREAEQVSGKQSAPRS
jgi:hypothetical protein